jgi:uncharacterized protein
MRMLNGRLQRTHVDGLRDFRIVEAMFAPHEFEWDEAKAASNERKHDIPFASAAAAFHDPRRVDFDVSREQDREMRRKVVGLIGNRLYTVVYTVRGSACRIISARLANTSEKRRYGYRPLHL